MMLNNLSEATTGNEIVVVNRYYPRGLREQDIQRYYSQKSVIETILKETKGKNIVLAIATDINQYIIKRNDANGSPLVLTRANYDQLVHGRTISIFAELELLTNTWCIDIDPGPAVSESRIKGAVASLLEFAEQLSLRGETIRWNYYRITTTSKGYHVYIYMKRKATQRENYEQCLELLNEYFKDSEYAINKSRNLRSNEINFDLSVMKPRGCHVVVGSLNRNGLICLDVTKNWKSFVRGSNIIRFVE